MTSLHDEPGLHHEDAVAAEHGVHPVRDGDHGPVPQTLLDHLLQLPVSLRVHVGRGLVHQHDLAGREHGAGEAQQLLLARRQRGALLRDAAAVTWVRTLVRSPTPDGNIILYLLITYLRAW